MHPYLSVIASSRRRIDPDAAAFAIASGATDLTVLNQLATYLKDQSLWTHCRIFPFKSAQNKGSGTTVYGLGGLCVDDITLFNSPEWGANGIAFALSSSQYATAPAIAASTYTACYFISYKSNSATYATTGGARLANMSFDGTNNRLYSGFGTNYTSGKIGCRFGDTTARNSTIDVATASYKTFFQSTTGQMYQDNISGGAGTVTSGGGSITLQICQIGGDTNGYFDGSIKAMLRMNTVPTLAQREAITNYLNAL